jgi:hypothetical protein
MPCAKHVSVDGSRHRKSWASVACKSDQSFRSFLEEQEQENSQGLFSRLKFDRFSF